MVLRKSLLTNLGVCLATAGVFIGASLVSGCRIKAPTVAEQQALMERKSFPGGVPAWFSPGAAGPAAQGDTFGGGLIPRKLGAPPLVASASIVEPTTEISNANAIGPLQPQLKPKGFATDATTPQGRTAVEKSVETKAAPASALDRITQGCPGVESQVTQALTTTEVDSRIQQYEALLSKCPRSSDLHVWLGKDYLNLGQNAKAGRLFEKALVLDNTNAEAKQLLEKARSTN